MKLVDAVTVLRSKNAGPYQLAYDIFFRAPESFDAFAGHWKADPGRLSSTLGVRPADIQLELLPELSAMKITVPRARTAGSLADCDVLGCQQVALMMNLEL